MDHDNPLLASTMSLFSEGERHVVELSFASREDAERIFEWLDQMAGEPWPEQ